MPLPTLPTPPDADALRRLVRSTTIRPVDRAPTYTDGHHHVLANACGWVNGWKAAAVFERRFTHAGQHTARAELVIADGMGTTSRPIQWYHATLAEWPVRPRHTT